MLDSAWFAPALALLAGVITAFTPCCLSSVPLIIGYVSGTDNKRKGYPLRLSLVFSLGMVLVSTAFGIAIALAGSMMKTQMYTGVFYIILGVLLILMALQVWELFTFIPSTYLVGKSTKRGYSGAFIAGTLAGVFSSPCSTPVLVAMLTIVAEQGDLVRGGVLLALYSVGHSILFIVAGISTARIKSFIQNKKYSIMSQSIKYGTGAVILSFGFYLLYLGV